MWETIQLILLLGVYVLISYLFIRFVFKKTINLNPYLRLLLLSFLYALFWGIGIAANGGDPGFALPAPNIWAIILMYNDKLYRGVKFGLLVLGLWWAIIFIIMLIIYLIKRKREFQKI